MTAAARRAGRILKVGFTLRFHPGVRQAKQLCESGVVGPLFYVRAVYGHGGRAGYGGEWRGQRELSGGGELLDQGVHLLDLGRYFLGDFSEVVGIVPRYFWDIGDLEDNAFVLLRTVAGQVASLHTSWTQWRNQFLLEVFGRDGFIAVRGLGGSYGPETLTLGRRQSQSGPPLEETTLFEGTDSSWDDDWADFVDAIILGRPPAVGGDDGVAVMRLVDAVYATAERRTQIYPLSTAENDPR
jgi:predicted dehydrogenase